MSVWLGSGDVLWSMRLPRQNPRTPGYDNMKSVCHRAILVLCFGTGLRCACADQGANPRDATNPFAAHNAYPWRLYGQDRLDRALAAGLKHIEVDITYDPARKTIVATHDEKPNGREPRLDQLLEPLWQQWQAARRAKAIP